MSGDAALVGAPPNIFIIPPASDGSAYVFARSGATWSQVAKLTGTASYGFGDAVSLSGETALVGAYGDEHVGQNSGAAYVFTRGNPCVADGECPSGFCRDGRCCDSDCGGGVTNDCHACAIVAGASTDGICGLVAAGTSCGDTSDSACTDADTCDAAGACLANHEPSGAPCGDQGVICHLNDACDASAAASTAASSRRPRCAVRARTDATRRSAATARAAALPTLTCRREMSARGAAARRMPSRPETAAAA